MKNITTLLCFISILSTSLAQTPCIGGFAGPFPCNNVDLLSQVTLSTMGATRAAGDWGWVSPNTGIPYAIVVLTTVQHL